LRASHAVADARRLRRRDERRLIRAAIFRSTARRRCLRFTAIVTPLPLPIRQPRRHAIDSSMPQPPSAVDIYATVFAIRRDSDELLPARHAE